MRSQQCRLAWMGQCTHWPAHCTCGEGGLGLTGQLVSWLVGCWSQDVINFTINHNNNRRPLTPKSMPLVNK